MRDLIGQTLSNYEIIKKIGEGGMSDVYLAKQPSIGRDGVFKVLLSDLAKKDDSFLQRFQRELVRSKNVMQLARQYMGVG